MALPASVKHQLAHLLQSKSLISKNDLTLHPTAGGDINLSTIVRSEHHTFFAKFNRNNAPRFFEAEFEGLEAIEHTRTLSCPRPYFVAQFDDWQCLLMEYIPLTRSGSHFELGKAIASFHQQSANQNPPGYGFQTDNFIGSTPQLNKQQPNWANFWMNCRLKPQMHWASERGYSSVDVIHNSLLTAVNRILEEHTPEACLVHGDLWGGNKGFDDKGKPVIFDPACYYGDREVDLAMTELFGGFQPDFYRGYNAVWPLPSGYAQRKPLYNLYHQLNHLNIFGDSYLATVLGNAESLIACARA